MSNRVAMVSLHTSPTDLPGIGDAGGMNVYVNQLARSLAKLGTDVDIYTRARTSHEAAQTIAAGVRVIPLQAQSGRDVPKEELSRVVPEFSQVLGTWLRSEDYAAIHSHYWLSGLAALATESGLPLVHTSHTLATTKNAQQAAGQPRESAERIAGERWIAAEAAALVANTAAEAQELIDSYAADPAKIAVVNPGVDTGVFRPKSHSYLSDPSNPPTITFVGRLQPLKGPDVFLRAAAELVATEPDRYGDANLVVCGGTSGIGDDSWLPDLAAELGISQQVTWLSPRPAADLVGVYQEADLVVLPSHSESFGLVALEAQACGTPVVVSTAAGFRSSAPQNLGSLHVAGFEPTSWAKTIDGLLRDPAEYRRLSSGAAAYARLLDWSAPAETLDLLYDELAVERHIERLVGVHG